MARLLVIVVALLQVGTLAGAAPDLGSEQQRAAGKALYDKYCSQCHGDTGDGLGVATARVKPAPRDFTSGKYKLRTTPSGALPTDADIKRSIRNGLPYTSMPPWPALSEPQLQNLTYYLKTFSQDFANSDKIVAPIKIPEPPSVTPESIENGRTVYEQLGCAQCHGELGRGDGPSAPTLKDDWGDHIRPADMTMRWTFRGGPTRKDIFRTFSTGLNGTPMPSYYDSVEEQDRWDLVNYIYSLGEGDMPGYDNLLVVRSVEREIDLDGGLDELFADAPRARFPLVGQIVQPGRDFYPSATSIEAQAIYNRKEFALRLTWNDMRAETTGRNGPSLEVPRWDEQQHPHRSTGTAKPAGTAEEDFWGAEAAETGGDDFWGAEAADEGGDDFWGEGEGDAATATGPDTEFSDAVAVQLPKALPTGIRKPYFLFGDAQSPVDLWFVDLARGLPEQYVGRGAGLLEHSEADIIDVVASYDRGRWSVTFKRDLRSAANVTFDAGQYTPIAFSVWDGFNRERGNKRAVSAWFYLYNEPRQKASAVGPMLEAGLAVLVVEILIIALIRRRFSGQRDTERGDTVGRGTLPHGGVAG